MKYKVLSCLFGLFFTNNFYASEYKIQNQFYDFFNEKNNNSYNSNEISNLDDIKNTLDIYIAKNSSSTFVTGIPLLFQCDKYQNGKKFIINSGLQSKFGFQVTNQSLFQIGSNSKSFLSVVFLQLEAENKLSIENTVEDFLGNIYPKWNKIKIKQLLNMTSGIIDFANDDDTINKEVGKNPFRLITSDEILDHLKDKELWFNPGSNWKYSNTNYVLLGKIIEKVTNHSVSHEINERIIRPLKLNHTYYIETFPKTNVPKYEVKNLMDGYYFGDEKSQFSPYLTNGVGVIDYSMSWGNSAGSITSNVNDLNKYFHALLKQDKNGNSKLLAKKQYEELVSLVDTTNGKPLINGVNNENMNGYGLGLGAKYDSKLQSRFYTHSGGTLGFISKWIYFPEKNMSLIYSMNTTNMNNYMQEIFQPTLYFIFNKCY
ncbi:serine hydrolase [Silvanigrella paludirubra]|uniref:Serine hydrolase n=1 Tax=Silvanigrella paludirubra TaxID=2499159 RepID=A0A6N6VTW6_9BACT|nr:serine hydrolase domain-containing protein [Silvanigrella paludirubra]KAB8039101.1 serine hydrolase [Silvanigrella paludirubra]